MNYSFNSFLLFVFILFLPTACFPQSNRKTDSLENELKKSVDTTKINVLNGLALEYRKKTPDSALKLLNQALLLSEKIAFQKGKGYAYSNMGEVYFDKGNYDKAQSFYSKSLAIRESINDKQGVASSLSSIGDVNINQGNYKKALEQYSKSLAIRESLDDKNAIAKSLNNIAAAYYYLGNYEKALEYYVRTLKTNEALGNKARMINPSLGMGAVYYNMGKYEKSLIYYRQALIISKEVKSPAGLFKSLNNIGNVYEKLNNYDTALVYQLSALRITEELGDKPLIALSLMNIGNIYNKTKNYEKALEYYRRALLINKETGSKNGSAKSLLNIGIAYSQKGDVERALEYLKKGLVLANAIKSMEIMEKSNEVLSEVYVKKDDYKNAYTYYKRHANIKDSLLNENNSKNIAEINTKYETHKKENEIALLTKDKSLNEAQLKNQQFVIIGFVVGGLLVILLAFLAYNHYRIKQRASEEVKQINKEINQSINYAKRIQTSFLTSEKYIAQKLSDYFILFSPRNVVSGDFYWLMEKENNLYVCTADCTGHGIPGAFMSLISMGILNEIIYSKSHIAHTDDILNELRRIIILAVNPEGAFEEGRDGMDAVMCRFDFLKMELEYSAANNSFYIVRNGELIVYKADKMPVGKHIGEEKPFTRTIIPIEKGDCIYTFSDGYVDQFGGPKGKKFQAKQLKELILANSAKPMNEQKEILTQTLHKWMGNCEQVDDILVVGIRV